MQADDGGLHAYALRYLTLERITAEVDAVLLRVQRNGSLDVVSSDGSGGGVGSSFLSLLATVFATLPTGDSGREQRPKTAPGLDAEVLSTLARGSLIRARCIAYAASAALVSVSLGSLSGSAAAAAAGDGGATAGRLLSLGGSAPASDTSGACADVTHALLGAAVGAADGRSRAECAVDECLAVLSSSHSVAELPKWLRVQELLDSAARSLQSVSTSGSSRALLRLASALFPQSLAIALVRRGSSAFTARLVDDLTRPRRLLHNRSVAHHLTVRLVNLEQTRRQLARHEASLSPRHLAALRAEVSALTAGAPPPRLLLTRGLRRLAQIPGGAAGGGPADSAVTPGLAPAEPHPEPVLAGLRLWCKLWRKRALVSFASDPAVVAVLRERAPAVYAPLIDALVASGGAPKLVASLFRLAHAIGRNQARSAAAASDPAASDPAAAAAAALAAVGGWEEALMFEGGEEGGAEEGGAEESGGPEAGHDELGCAGADEREEGEFELDECASDESDGEGSAQSGGRRGGGDVDAGGGVAHSQAVAADASAGAATPADDTLRRHIGAAADALMGAVHNLALMRPSSLARLLRWAMLDALPLLRLPALSAAADLEQISAELEPEQRLCATSALLQLLAEAREEEEERENARRRHGAAAAGSGARARAGEEPAAPPSAAAAAAAAAAPPFVSDQPPLSIRAPAETAPAPLAPMLRAFHARFDAAVGSMRDTWRQRAAPGGAGSTPPPDPPPDTPPDTPPDPDPDAPIAAIEIVHGQAEWMALRARGFTPVGATPAATTPADLSGASVWVRRAGKRDGASLPPIAALAVTSGSRADRPDSRAHREMCRAAPGGWVLCGRALAARTSSDLRLWYRRCSLPTDAPITSISFASEPPPGVPPTPRVVPGLLGSLLSVSRAHTSKRAGRLAQGGGAGRVSAHGVPAVRDKGPAVMIVPLNLAAKPKAAYLRFDRPGLLPLGSKS